jgi:3-methyladenine DNA glycosylase AlkD
MDAVEILRELKSQSNPKNVAGMARFGINPTNTYGISIPTLRKMSKQIGTDHLLAEYLWASGIHEARILAAMIDDPSKVTDLQMEEWVKEFDSWDVCDQVCSNLFDKTALAYQKAAEWSARKDEFVKRAGFALMAALAFHDENAPDSKLRKFLPLIKRESSDDRNFVRKAVNWALRQIGKRNRKLNRNAIKVAREIARLESKSAHWVASDALRELTSPAVQKRLHDKHN